MRFLKLFLFLTVSLTFFLVESSWTPCQDNNECSPDQSCFEGYCCDNSYLSLPVNFISPINSLCKGSAIPIVINENCRVPDDTIFSVYLNNTKIHEGNRSGDEGWGLYLGEGIYQVRLGADIPPQTPLGKYALKVNYTINNTPYEVILNRNFDVTQDCALNVKCGHVLSNNDVPQINLVYNTPLTFNEGNTVYVGENSKVALNFTGYIISQCSNGVAAFTVPMIASFVYSGTNINNPIQSFIKDNFGSCRGTLNSYSNEFSNIITSDFNNEGKKASCDLKPWIQGISSNFVLIESVEKKTYLVRVVILNAYCDSPDYICPYIPENKISETDKSICYLGTRNKWQQVTGWIYLGNYTIKGFSPIINLSSTVISIGNGSFINNLPPFFYFLLKNDGDFKVTVKNSTSFSLNDFSAIIDGEGNISISGTNYYILTLNISKIEKRVMPEYRNEEISVLNFSEYNKTSFVYENRKLKKVILEYNYPINLNVSVDDAYSFYEISPINKTLIEGLNFSYEFECNSSISPYLLSTRDNLFFCNSSDDGFYNFYPIANITYPSKKPSGDPLKLCANRDIEFKHNSYDADDLLRISWDFGDGNVTIAAENYSRALTPNLGNINHSYSETNLYIIILNVSEMNRNQYDLDNVSIQIFKEGINIFPIITQPKGVINTYVVTFNASQSYILNCSPYLTLYNFTTDDNCLKCLYVLSPGSTSPLYGKVYFRWSISEDNLVWSPLVSPLDDPSYNHSLGILLSPQNYTRYGGIVFSKLFVEPKRRYAKFEMRFE